jgi:hypothetical protein
MIQEMKLRLENMVREENERPYAERVQQVVVMETLEYERYEVFQQGSINLNSF